MNRIIDFNFKNVPAVRRIKVVPKQKARPKSICFLLLEIYYKILHIFCCLDFGFFEHKSHRIFWKMFTLTQFTVCCFIKFLFIHLIHFNSTFTIISYAMLVVYYIMNVLTLILVSYYDKTLRLAFIHLQRIDFMMQIDLSFETGIKIIIATCFQIGVNISFVIISCIVYDKCYTLTFLNSYFWTLQHSILVSYALMFYVINCRLKKLVSMLRSTNSDILMLQRMYKMIADLAEEQKTAFGPLFALALLFNTPQLMAKIYQNVFFGPNRTTVISGAVLFSYSKVMQNFLVVFSPALCAGMLASQTDEIKFILHDKLLHIYEEHNAQAIKRFIHYVEERDCRFRVYKLIPLDESLIGMVLNFCVTYLIVLFQFTK